MNFKTLLFSPLVLLGVTFFPNQAQAREFSQWHQTLDISGQLKLPSGERRARQLRVELDTDGRAFVRFDTERDGKNRDNDDRNDWNQNSNRQNWSNGQTAFSGVWYGANDRLTVDLREGLGRQTVFGRVTFYLKNTNSNRPEARTITLDGGLIRRPYDTTDFSGRFAVEDDDWTNRPQTISELSSTKSGSGTLVLGADRQKLRRARVELGRDGRAQIQLEGDRTYSYEGRWRQTQAREIAVKLDGSAAGIFGAPGQNRRRDDESLGSGEITLSGASFQKLNLQGRLGDRDFKASFEVGQTQSNDDGVLDRWRNGIKNKKDDDALRWNAR